MSAAERTPDAGQLAREAAHHLRRFLELVAEGFRIRPQFWNEQGGRIQREAFAPILKGHEGAPAEEFQGIALGWIPVLFRGPSRHAPERS